ncbi:MAG TPA: hypothetical protein VLJ68_00560 [Chitinophagaceae bacterium]|nr:hypothetical protein [Chitinophagaceae bacterium]
MRRLLIMITAIVVFAGCNSGKKNNTDEGIKKDGNNATTTTTSVPDRPSGKIDIESFGPLKLGQHVAETRQAIGPPGATAKPVEWAADGMMHEDWNWFSYGLLLNMSYDKTNKDATLAIFSITAEIPCDFKTKAGMGIGSSYAEVEATYKKDIDPEATDKTQITVGSVYGGIIFSFTNDKVSKVFLGAQAE